MKKLLQSSEADFIPIFTKEMLEKYDEQHYLDIVETVFGKNSDFHKLFGVYADGCEFVTATLPKGWQDRLIKVQDTGTDMRIAYFLEPHDLAIAKLVAHREKDVEFLKAMLDE